MIVWKLLLSLVAAVITAPFYHNLCLGWLYERIKDERVERLGHYVLIVALTILYFLVLEYGIDSGERREHYYPEQWEPVL